MDNEIKDTAEQAEKTESAVNEADKENTESNPAENVSEVAEEKNTEETADSKESESQPDNVFAEIEKESMPEITSVSEGKAEKMNSGEESANKDAQAKKKIQIKNIPGLKMIITNVIMIILLIVSLVLKNNGEMVDVYYDISRPYHKFMMNLCSYVPFSVAELIYIVLVISIVVYIIWSIVHLFKDKNKWLRVYTSLMTLITITLIIVTAYVYLWTPYYYAPSFAEQSGISDQAIYTEDLATVTNYFAQLANEYADKIERDENGNCTIDRNDIISRAADNYDAAVVKWTFLEGQKIQPKAIMCSKVMSLLDFTGFFYPPTGETNVDIDSPAFMLPFTCEHEISHQRGIGIEQECNFIATIACLDCGDDEFIYSGALTAYIYLQNALKKVDTDAFKAVRASLSDQVLADLKVNNEYWAGYSTAISEISNDAYESFLEGNGQELGLASYGACVNLLVHYYIDRVA